MIRYEVTLHVEPAAVSAVERFMRTRHIPDVFATGCFAEVRFDRLDAPADGAAPDSGRVMFRTTYHAARRADLDRYLAEHTARLRADFVAQVGASATVTRAVWSEVERWPAEGTPPAR